MLHLLYVLLATDKVLRNDKSVRRSILLDSLEAELRALAGSYELPHCEALTGRRLDIDYYVYERDECYENERRSGNHMACLEEAGPGLCLAFLSIAEKTFLCDAIPSALARMKCIKQLTAFGHDIETYARAEVFRSTESIWWATGSEVRNAACGWIRGRPDLRNLGDQDIGLTAKLRRGFVEFRDGLFEP